MSGLFKQFVVVLHQPRDVRNIGAAVRALLNTGFGQLRLVSPAAYAPADLHGIAHRSEELVAQIAVFEALPAALADCHMVVATSARSGEARPARADLRAACAELAALAAAGGRVGLLFGPEDHGLDRAALSQAGMLVSLPVDPAYPSLNLAQAVLLLLYELRQALVEAPSAPPPLARASHGEIEALLAALRELAAASSFIKSGDGSAQFAELRMWLQRSPPSPREAALLAALVREARKRLP